MVTNIPLSSSKPLISYLGNLSKIILSCFCEFVDKGGSFTCACNTGYTDRGISNGKQCWLP